MSSIVQEMQSDAINTSVRVSDLLRKALIVARKLGLQEFEQWVSLELNGYKDVKVPDYRMLTGEIKVWNEYHGWQPVFFENTKLAERLSSKGAGQPIGELETLFKEGKKTHNLVMHFPKHIELQIMKDAPYLAQPVLLVPEASVYGIIEAVRNALLHWALKLEQDGILGEGITFSEREKTIASTINYHIENFVGEMNNSQLQQGTYHSTQAQTIQNVDVGLVKEILVSLKDSLEKIGVEGDQREQLLADIQTIEPQLSSPKPNSSIIREGIRSIRHILEQAAGNIIASGILQRMSELGSSLW
jgi:hypothetical protein